MRQVTGICGVLLFAVCLCPPAGAQNADEPLVLAEWPLAELDETQLSRFYEFHQMTVAGVRHREMSLRVKGADPYIAGPELNFDAYAGRRLIVNMSCQDAARAAVFFTTDSAPDFSENKKVSFSVVADQSPHKYTIDPTGNPEWRGTVTRLRLDVEGAPLEAEIRLHELRVEQPPVHVSVDSFSADRGLITPDTDILITGTISNCGGSDVSELEVRLTVPDGIELVDGETETDVHELVVGEALTFEWTVRAPETGVFVLTLAAEGEPSVSVSAPLTLAAGKPLPTRLPATDSLHGLWTDTGDVSLGSSQLEFLALRNKFGYGPAGLYLRRETSPEAELVAVLPYMARIELADGTFAETFPQESRLKRGTFNDERLVQASFISPFDCGKLETTFSVNETDPWLAVTYTFTASREVDVRHLFGPMVLAGESAFGEAKSAALFPGLEYLVGNERSSSDDDIRDEYVRLVPDPEKVTVPYMAVQHGRSVVQLMWPPPGLAESGWSPLSAMFASPNWFHGQTNHLMALFAPGGKDYVAENQLAASEPIRLNAGDQLVIHSKLATYEAAGRGLADATRMWFAAYDVPEVLPPRTVGEAVKLATAAYTTTCWDADANGWHPTLGADPAPAEFIPSAVVALLMNSLITTDNAAAAECTETARRAMSGRPPARYGPALAWRVGGVRETIAALEQASAASIEKQRSNGSWVYAGDDNDPPLGTSGATAPGICAAALEPVLTYAGVTGDAAATRAAVAGLEFMSRFTVPRGAQLWETPLHAPDLLASARAGSAFLAGYRLTGNTRYLEEARYWAETGLPFVYLWHDPLRPALAFATVPAFGATFYRPPGWFGRPVQWCGLEYGRFLARLAARLSYDEIYQTVARGILYSAIHQQRAAGPFAGTYPDVWDLATNQPREPYLAPELLLELAYALFGYSTDLEWCVCRTAAREIHVSSAARLLNVEVGIGDLEIWMRYPAGGTCFTVLTGIGREPIGVAWDETQLVHSTETEPSPGRWAYNDQLDTLIITCKFRQDEQRLRIAY